MSIEATELKKLFKDYVHVERRDDDWANAPTEDDDDAVTYHVHFYGLREEEVKKLASLAKDIDNA